MLLDLEPAMIQVIGDALMELPFKRSAPVIQELQKQVNEQQQKQVEVKNENDSS